MLAFSSDLHAEMGEFSGWVNGQTRYYPDTGENVDEQLYPAAALQLNYSQNLTDDDQLVIGLFARGDTVDDERNYVDAREFLWLHYGDNFQFRAGVGQASWGVSELFKITDVINQKDRAELPLQRKLGQPMAAVSFYLGDDLIELYSLYDVRPAWFPGEDGRMRYPILVDPDHQEYDRGKSGRWDFAARWKTRLADVDIALSHFYGVTRDPYFIFNYDFADPYLIPVYEKVNQTSLEMVYPWQDVLLKLEATYQTGSIEQFESVVAGFEYTFGGVFQSDFDLSWYVEAIWDSRDQIYATLFDHDVGVAARLAFNDARDSNLILGVVADYKYSEAFGYLFWTNNFGASWTMNITGQYFMANEPRLDPRDYAQFQALADDVEAGNYPLPQALIDSVLEAFENTTISQKQYEIMLERLEEIQAGQGDYFTNVEDYTDVPQILFDLLRISDNSQKMNLIERDGYIQVDVFYHF
ncbi:hypothetical protein [Ketobacter sp.]|uniref:hypothetical protein n=1 Tax=Ketobacter sp. TaxID=2083498 RepID=UPI000F25E7B9|nr:hypothetical protein [Ketobacter sp.]RLU00281.1 MAG: hypothetical protein D9N14_07265 [Ketobacter sp.]